MTYRRSIRRSSRRGRNPRMARRPRAVSAAEWNQTGVVSV